jgi:hypothetical protein
MERMKAELDKEEDGLEEYEEEEEESEDEEEEINTKPKFDDFEILKANIKSKMPKKIASKGITSILRPIEEESMDETAFQNIPIIETSLKNNVTPVTEEESKNSYPDPTQDDFKTLTNEQKRKRIEEMMKNPSAQKLQSTDQIDDDDDNDQVEDSEMSQNQSDEIQNRLGKFLS